MDKAVIEELSKPLDRKHIKPPAPGKYGDYIEGHHAIREANRIFNFDWSHSVDSLSEASRDLVEVEKRNRGGQPEKIKQWRVTYVCSVSVVAGQVRHSGVGAGHGFASEIALGDAIESAVKEAETDALKRALVKFGDQFGLALYDKDRAHVSDPNVEILIRRIEAVNNRPDGEGLYAETPPQMREHPRVLAAFQAWGAKYPKQKEAA